MVVQHPAPPPHHSKRFPGGAGGASRVAEHFWASPREASANDGALDLQQFLKFLHRITAVVPCARDRLRVLVAPFGIREERNATGVDFGHGGCETCHEKGGAVVHGPCGGKGSAEGQKDRTLLRGSSIRARWLLCAEGAQLLLLAMNVQTSVHHPISTGSRSAPDHV